MTALAGLADVATEAGAITATDATGLGAGVGTGTATVDAELPVMVEAVVVAGVAVLEVATLATTVLAGATVLATMLDGLGVTSMLVVVLVSDEAGLVLKLEIELDADDQFTTKIIAKPIANKEIKTLIPTPPKVSATSIELPLIGKFSPLG